MSKMSFVSRIVSTAAQVVVSWAAPLFALGGQRLSGGDPFCLSHYSMMVRELCARMVASMCLGTAWVMQLPMVALAAALAASLPFLVA